MGALLFLLLNEKSIRIYMGYRHGTLYRSSVFRTPRENEIARIFPPGKAWCDDVQGNTVELNLCYSEAI